MKRFNVRVYGLLIYNENVLVSDELIGGKEVTKFPGGGLEYGEATIEGLKREFMEELSVEIEIIAHFYTTDFFVASAFDSSQVISIYYTVKTLCPEKIPMQSVEDPNQKFRWINISEINSEIFTFAIDKRVGELLKSYL